MVLYLFSIDTFKIGDRCHGLNRLAQIPSGFIRMCGNLLNPWLIYPCKIRLICVIRGLISVAKSEAIQSLLFADSQIYSKISIYKRLQIITTESKQLATE